MDEKISSKKKVIVIVHKKKYLRSLDDILNEPLIKKPESNDFENTNKILNNPVFGKTDNNKIQLIKANQKLVYKSASQFYKHYCNRLQVLEFEDLISAGNVGLLKAIERFDYKLNFTFSTYALYWINQSIMREIENNLGMTRIPVHFIEKINRSNSGVELSDEDKTNIELAKLHFNKSISLDNMVSMESEDTSLKELTSSYNSNTPNNIALYYETDYDTFRKEFINRVQNVLSSRVKPRYLAIFNSRYGLDDGMPKSLEEVGDEIGVTRERIRQICELCLGKLRASRQFDKEDYSTFEVKYDL